MNSIRKTGSWRGLFQKEWMVSKAEVITLFLLNIAIGLGLPVIIRKAFDIPQDILEALYIFVGFWLLTHIFIGLKLLYTSLKHEMKHPDIWLHSPKSIFRLVGVKALFSALITGGLLMVGGVTLGMSLHLSEMIQLPSLIDRVLVSLSVMITTFLISIYIMAMGYFFWSIYQVLRSRIGRIAVIVTAVIFLAYTYLLEKVRLPSIFDTMTSFGPVKFTDTKFYGETSYNTISIIVPDGVVFTVGGLLFYGVIAAIFFIVGSLLFEKKVRF